MKVIPFVHEGLGNSSYLVQLNDDSAVLIDPDRSVDRYLREAENRGVRISGVLETHLHADFVTGSREVLQLTGIEPHASRAGEVRFPHRAVDPGDIFTMEGFSIRVIGSPGHTPEHVSYILESPRHEPLALFSGGSLIVGGAARTDLVSPDLTEQLTRDQYRTLKQSFAGLPDETLLYPTHGGGSFCSAGAGDERTSTLGRERATNSLLRFDDEDEFTAWFPTTFPGAPDYFFKMRPINQAGPRLRGDIPSPQPLSPDEFRAAAERALVIDLRPIDEYHRAHIPGSLSIAFRPSYATWLGWLVPLDTPLLLLPGDDPLDRVVDESLLVGQENFAGWLPGGIKEWERAGLPVRGGTSVGPDAARRLLTDGAQALDVREPDEFAARHVDRAKNIPLGRLFGAVESIPDSGKIITYCGRGERSTTAVSVLERQGIDAVSLEGGIGALG